MANIYNSKNNITFRNIVDTFRTIAEKHFQLQSFHSGQLDNVDIEKLDTNRFPLLYAEPQPATVDIGTLTYTFDIIVADRIIENKKDLDTGTIANNFQSIYSDAVDDAYSNTLQIMKDVISEFRQSTQSTSWADGRTDIVLPITLTPFTARFSNMLTGFSGTFSIVVNNDNNLCVVPITPNS